MANRGANRDHPASFLIACVLNRPGPCLLPLLLAGGAAIALIPPARADLSPPQGVAARLALPGCRNALGLSATPTPAELLRADPGLAAKLNAAPACRIPGDALSRLELLEQELAASRQRIAAQQSQLAAETARQDTLAADLAQLRRQLTAQAAGAGAAISGTATAGVPAPATAAAATAPVATTPSAPAAPATAAAEGSPSALSASAPPITTSSPA